MGAKKKSTRKSAPKTRVIRRYITKAAPRVRRGLAAARQAASDEKHLLIAGGTAGLLGFLNAKGIKLPTIPGVPPEGTVALATFLLSKGTKGDTSRILRHACTGATAIALYKAGSKLGGKAIGDDDEAPMLGNYPMLGNGAGVANPFQGAQFHPVNGQPMNPAAAALMQNAMMGAMMADLEGDDDDDLEGDDDDDLEGDDDDDLEGDDDDDLEGDDDDDE